MLLLSIRHRIIVQIHTTGIRNSSISAFFHSGSTTSKEGCHPSFYNEATSYQSSSQGNTTGSKEKRILICGDGDLSFGASLATKMSKRSDEDVQVIASVWESKQQHRDVYSDSEKNVQLIREAGQEVIFGVDATKIPEHFDNSFDRIQFNFPHWRGKSNIRINRELIENFFASSRKVLSRGGQIHMALFDHQGGSGSQSILEWKRSWMPARYAAEHNLLLTHVLPFEPTYNLSAYQFRDRSFKQSKRNTSMYIFSDPDGIYKAPSEIQLYSGFRQLVALPPNESPEGETLLETSSSCNYWTRDKILDSKLLQNYLQSLTPPGVRIEVNFKGFFDGNRLLKRGKVDRIFVDYQVRFFGEQLPIARKGISSPMETYQTCIADGIREITGVEMKTWTSSNVLPCSLLAENLQ